MKREVKIGIFAVLMICCAWAGIRFLSGIDIFSRNVDYYAEYDDINGIHHASSVLIQGVKVGTVTDIILDPANSDKVVVKLSLKSKYQIPSDTEAKIFSPGMMSSMAINLCMGSSKTYLKAGDTMKSSYDKGIMDIASKEIESMTSQFKTISEQLTITLTEVNALLKNNATNIDATIASLSGISTNLNSLLASQKQNMERTSEGIANFTETLGNNSQKIDSIISDVAVMTSELSEAQIGANLEATLTELNTLLSSINNAEGSMGKVFKDEQLYNNLAGATNSLDLLLEDMKANPKRYVHFSLFGRTEKSE